MSDYITLEIQEEIIKRLPVRSLVRCRSVSKTWKALIDSPRFIAASLRQTRPHHLFIKYDYRVGQRYVSIVDDDSFPLQMSAPTLPSSIRQLPRPSIVGASGGLLCFYGLCSKLRKYIAVLWNPTIRKSVAIDVPNVKYGSYDTVLGFGVCPKTSDPKIVKIIHTSQTTNTNIMSWNVEIYTLSSREWRTPSCNLPRPSIHVTSDRVVIDRFIYWLSMDRIVTSDVFRHAYTLISFDITNDEFREVCIPDVADMIISKVWESLALLVYDEEDDKRICVVWKMEHGVPNSFTKLFTVKTPHASIEIIGFRNGDKPIIEVSYYDEETLIVYEPYSGHIDYLGIPGLRGTLNSYMETLLLLNQ